MPEYADYGFLGSIGSKRVIFDFYPTDYDASSWYNGVFFILNSLTIELTQRESELK